MKSIEDDPSITPGSVVRSPLSLAAIKDPDAIFSSSTKTSPPPQVNAEASIPSLSNSTWSFIPPATTPSAFTRLVFIKRLYYEKSTLPYPIHHILFYY